MGLRHGLFCMGCCAALMVLLFAVAVMDLRWVAALTVLVTAEKLLPGARFWRVAIGVGAARGRRRLRIRGAAGVRMTLHSAGHGRLIPAEGGNAIRAGRVGSRATIPSCPPRGAPQP